jgi:hypothetical protein
VVDVRACKDFNLLAFFRTTLIASEGIVFEHFIIGDFLNARVRHILIEEGIDKSLAPAALSLSKHYAESCLLAELLEYLAVDFLDGVISVFQDYLFGALISKHLQYYLAQVRKV